MEPSHPHRAQGHRGGMPTPLPWALGTFMVSPCGAQHTHGGRGSRLGAELLVLAVTCSLCPMLQVRKAEAQRGQGSHRRPWSWRAMDQDPSSGGSWGSLGGM